MSRVDLSPLKGKSVLVTGATGLIGTALCGVLRTSGAGRLIELGRGEIGDGAHDFIVHAGGYSAPSRFMAEPIATIREATAKTDLLLDNLTGSLAKGGRFLFLSTSEVYSGAQPAHREEDIGTVTPDHPRAPYIFGKLCGETICHAYRAQGVDAKIARVSLAYGPGTRKHDSRALNQFIEQALTTNRIVLKDAGLASRTYCYVTDVVEMLLNILLHGKQPLYNVGGTGPSVTIRSLARRIGNLTESEVVAPSISSNDSAPAEVRLDMSRYAREFGPQGHVTLDEGLQRTIDYQRGLYR